MIGVGPIIVIPQLILTAVGIILSARDYFPIGQFSMFRIPFLVAGIGLIFFGVYMWFCANYRTRVDRYITTNKLATSGVYQYVRNPIYSSFLILCTGAVLIANNVILFSIPLVCWAYMTIFLIHSEEKWLSNLYGEEYVDYCKRVNRCIPWFSHYHK